jgi:hypothetical protein
MRDFLLKNTNIKDTPELIDDIVSFISLWEEYVKAVNKSVRFDKGVSFENIAPSSSR